MLPKIKFRASKHFVVDVPYYGRCAFSKAFQDAYLLYPFCNEGLPHL